MSKTVPKRNPFARELRNPLYRQRKMQAPKEPDWEEDWEEELDSYEFDKELGLTTKE